MAFTFVEAIRSAPNAIPIEPGPRHFDLFARLCVEAGARGNLVADGYLAALAIESGCEWITTDRDFASSGACAGAIRSIPDAAWRDVRPPAHAKA